MTRGMAEPGRKSQQGLAKRVGKSYLSTQAQTSNKLDLIIMSLEGAIKAARQEDAAQVKRIMGLLMTGLDFSKMPEFTLGQFRIYKQCQDAAEAGAFKEVLHLLTQQRDAWKYLKDHGKGQGE